MRELEEESRARRVAVRERERVFFPDGIRCSISEVVGAVIVEDRLLSLPSLLPLSLSPDGSLRPTSLVSPKPPPPLLQNAPYANLPAAEGSPCPLPYFPHYFTFTVLHGVGSHQLPL